MGLYGCIHAALLLLQYSVPVDQGRLWTREWDWSRTNLSHYKYTQSYVQVMIRNRVCMFGVEKPSGDEGVATGTGKGCCWESLVTNLHRGGLDVMVVYR
jgi:hypothetical protein